MTVAITTDAPEIVGRIEPALMADPIRNTVLASVRDQLRAGGAGGWCAYNAVALAARSSAELPVALTDKWTDVPVLAAAVRELPSLVGIGGPVATVREAVAELGRRPSSERAERLYRLDRLVEPSGVPGRVRRAGTDDVALVASWLGPFIQETQDRTPDETETGQFAESAVRAAAVLLWLAETGQPVSMAAVRRPAAGVSRIGPVYTPPDQRGHGYGSAIAAAAAQSVLAIGAVPVLYTDIANPTSNKIYRAIGFRPVADRLSVTFR